MTTTNNDSEYDTLEEFIRAHRISSSATPAPSNPNMIGGMPAGSYHWTVTLEADGRSMTVPFSQGPALRGAPSTADVLECLASDAALWENTEDHYDLCAELGETPSRETERTYAVIGEQVAELRALLGRPAYHELVWELER